jgi:NADH:ubiquinone reductase (non-electrogenic)
VLQAFLQATHQGHFFPIHRDQVAESAEDIGRHLNRAIRELPTTKAFDKLVGGGRGGKLRLQADKPVVLVLGSGWGAHSLMKVCACCQLPTASPLPRRMHVFAL